MSQENNSKNLFLFMRLYADVYLPTYRDEASAIANQPRTVQQEVKISVPFTTEVKGDSR